MCVYVCISLRVVKACKHRTSSVCLHEQFMYVCMCVCMYVCMYVTYGISLLVVKAYKQRMSCVYLYIENVCMYVCVCVCMCMYVSAYELFKHTNSVSQVSV